MIYSKMKICGKSMTYISRGLTDNKGDYYESQNCYPYGFSIYDDDPEIIAVDRR